MSRKIKLLWDFRGEDAAETAKHHTIHLKEFAEFKNNLAFSRNRESTRKTQCFVLALYHRRRSRDEHLSRRFTVPTAENWDKLSFPFAKSELGLLSSSLNDTTRVLSKTIMKNLYY